MFLNQALATFGMQSTRTRRRGLTPAALRHLLVQCGKRREPTLVIGPPGVGKTYAAKAAAQDLLHEGYISGFEVITGSKDLTPASLFEATLVVSESSEKYITMLPSLVRKHVGKWLIPIDDKRVRSPEQALRHWPRDAWFQLIFDEATRATASFIDGLLPVCNDFQVTIEGVGFYAPLLVQSLANPAGMDASTVAFSHAYTSRQFARITMYQPGPEEIARTYSLPGVRQDADRLEVPLHCRPTDEHALLACGVLTLLWGLPLDRKGLACLSDDALSFIAEVARRDSKLASLMADLGDLVHFSCDPRKGRRWLTSAMHEAADEGVAFDLDHLLITGVRCLSCGMKVNFSEGQEPHLQLKLEDTIEAITERALGPSLPKLRDVLAERARAVAKSENPATLTKAVAPALFRDGATRVGLLQRLLTQHERCLRSDEVPDREVRTGVLADFLQRAARLNPILPTADLLVSARTLASRTDSPLLSKGDFLTRADLHFLTELAGALDQLTPVGAALASLAVREGGTPALLTLDEEVRLACRTYPLATPFEGELRRCLDRHPQWRGKGPHATAVLEHALQLSADSDVRPVLQQLFELFPISGQCADPSPFFRDLFREAQRQAKRQYQDRFDRLCELLENPA